MQRVEYKGWPNCYRIANEIVETVITGDVGPRIIRFGFVAQENEFKEFEAMLGQSGGPEWRIYGGHRLWYAPEAMPRTYYPDNQPVEVEDHGKFVRVIQPVEPTTGIQKELDVALSPSTAHIRVTHRLRNRASEPVELAPWALSVMAPGGVAIIPLPQVNEGLLPSSTIAIWPYTRMTDPRWTWGDRYILLAQTPGAPTRQKTSVYSTEGWAAYARNDHCFVKTFPIATDARYPDFNSTVEAYTDTDMLELETVGPLTVLEPGHDVQHVEDWHLLSGVPAIKTEQAVDEHILPQVRSLLP